MHPEHNFTYTKTSELLIIRYCLTAVQPQTTLTSIAPIYATMTIIRPFSKDGKTKLDDEEALIALSEKDHGECPQPQPDVERQALEKPEAGSKSTWSWTNFLLRSIVYFYLVHRLQPKSAREFDREMYGKMFNAIGT